MTVTFWWRVTTGGCTVVAFDHMEVVQVVQDRDNMIPLIAGKPAVARVFLKLIDAPKPPVGGVTVLLRGFRNGAELPGSPKRPFGSSPFTAQNLVRREQIDHSVNFELLKEWIEEGDTELRAEIRIPPCSSGNRPELLNGNQRATFSNFRRQGRTTFTVGWIPFCYQPDPAVPAICPNETHIADWDYLMRRPYPIPPENVQYRKVPIPAPPPWTSAMEGGLLGQIGQSIRATSFKSAVRKYKLAGEGRFFDHLVGFLPQIIGAVAGQGDLPGDVAIVVENRPSGTLTRPIENPLKNMHYNASHELRIPGGNQPWRLIYHLAPQAVVIR